MVEARLRRFPSRRAVGRKGGAACPQDACVMRGRVFRGNVSATTRSTCKGQDAKKGLRVLRGFSGGCNRDELPCGQGPRGRGPSGKRMVEGPATAVPVRQGGWEKRWSGLSPRRLRDARAGLRENVLGTTRSTCERQDAVKGLRVFVVSWAAGVARHCPCGQGPRGRGPSGKWMEGPSPAVPVRQDGWKKRWSGLSSRRLRDARASLRVNVLGTTRSTRERQDAVEQLRVLRVFVVPHVARRTISPGGAKEDDGNSLREMEDGRARATMFGEFLCLSVAIRCGAEKGPFRNCPKRA
jgi:hypothetical protein